MFTIGTDSEHGLYRDGRLVSAIGKIPGTKKEPYPLLNGGGLQVDNVLLEWNSPIAHTANQFNAVIEQTLLDIKVHAPEYTLGFESSYKFDPSELNSFEAWKIGCEPDYNAWKFTSLKNMKQCINDKPGFNGNTLRTAAAHIHISPIKTPALAAKLVRLADLYLGLPSLFVDLDRIRRTLYGTAGSFRFKRYANKANGVEYRVLGSFWIKNDLYRAWVFNTMKWIYDNLEDLPEPPINIVKTINNYNLKEAEKYIKSFNVEIP
jgi:hypothetical protein